MVSAARSVPKRRAGIPSEQVIVRTKRPAGRHFVESPSKEGSSGKCESSQDGACGSPLPPPCNASARRRTWRAGGEGSGVRGGQPMAHSVPTSPPTPLPRPGSREKVDSRPGEGEVSHRPPGKTTTRIFRMSPKEPQCRSEWLDRRTALSSRYCTLFQKERLFALCERAYGTVEAWRRDAAWLRDGHPWARSSSRRW